MLDALIRIRRSSVPSTVVVDTETPIMMCYRQNLDIICVVQKGERLVTALGSFAPGAARHWHRCTTQFILTQLQGRVEAVCPLTHPVIREEGRKAIDREIYHATC